ncbi:MAG: hypothetical protein K1X55_07715 [Chitinophagales bacterium]|nr:hypothetical protein [Chitinophagales bacterium]
MVQVYSETDTLRQVVIHQPDYGIEQVTPDIAEELLYDDIVYLPKMVKEHKVFTNNLRTFLGDEGVLEFNDLLEHVITIDGVKDQLLFNIEKLENAKPEVMRILEGLNHIDLADTLISGMHPETEETLMHPIPNLVFTRDIGVAIHDHFLICKANKKARFRENILAKAVFNHHPIFEPTAHTGKVIDFVEWENFDPKNDISIEGGDVMMLQKGHLFVGLSERTSHKAIDRLREILFSKNVIDTLTIVKIPAKRYCMHLDTIFTMVDRNVCIGFEPLVFKPNFDVVVEQYVRNGANQRFDSLKTCLQHLIPDIQTIPCGGGIFPFAEREQWTDGSNLVALKAGVVYGYERNEYTAEALEKAGFEVWAASGLTKEFKDDAAAMEKMECTFITIPSAELSRARGGPHCMTMPVSRM